MSIPRKTCRSCDSPGLELVLPLGETPLANSLLTRDQLGDTEPVFPLDLAFCPTCSLVQITETVPPEQIFRDYVYFSSFSDTMVGHARDLVDRLISSRGLGEDHLAVEIASNDGYLLQHYRNQGVPVLGIEPARNVARVAQEKGIRTLCDFFGAGLSRKLAGDGLRADVLHAHNVLAHVADLNGFVAGIGTILRRRATGRSGRATDAGGLAVIEFPYVKDMFDRGEFDTIYHEHLCYFSLTALDRLLRRHDLAPTNVERLEIHGGSLRVFVAHAGDSDFGSSGTPPDAPRSDRPRSVAALLADEESWGVDELSFYLALAGRVETIRLRLCELLGSLKSEGKRIAAYGAAAKGSTLLNTLKIGSETLDFVVDRSSHKQGRYMPGVHLPIRAPDHLEKDRPDYLLLLSWNLADEVLEQQAAFREAGGKFIIPLPEPRIV